MRLKGTMTEQAYRAELQRNHDYIFNTEVGTFLRTCIEQVVGRFITAYTLYWIPDDGTDFFTLLVDGKIIICMEIEYEQYSSLQEKGSPKLVDYSSCTTNDYIKGLSKAHRIKFEVAREMCHKDMNQ